MRKLVKMVMEIAIVIIFVSAVSPKTFAIKEFKDIFKEKYVDPSNNAEFQELASRAKCNVCHVDDENKKMRNPYGETLERNGLEKKYKALLKRAPAKAKQEIDDIFKKVEEMKANASQTYGERIKDGKLPGGNVNGK